MQSQKTRKEAHLWRCGNGEIIDVRDMSDTHIANAMSYLRNHADDELSKEYLALFADEQEQRSILKRRLIAMTR